MLRGSKASASTRQRTHLLSRVAGIWLVAVNSCVANRWTWDARGLVGTTQLRRLDALLQRLTTGPRILATHYPVCLANGRPEDPHTACET